MHRRGASFNKKINLDAQLNDAQCHRHVIHDEEKKSSLTPPPIPHRIAVIHDHFGTCAGIGVQIGNCIWSARF